MCMYACVCECVYACMHVCVYVYTCMQVCVGVRVMMCVVDVVGCVCVCSVSVGEGRTGLTGSYNWGIPYSRKIWRGIKFGDLVRDRQY